MPLKLPARQLDHHISTICRQLEAAKFLQQCESEGRSVVGVAADLNSNLETGTVPPIPTLFGNSTERAHLSALVILCGKNVEEGFGITFRYSYFLNLYIFNYVQYLMLKSAYCLTFYISELQNFYNNRV